MKKILINSTFYITYALLIYFQVQTTNIISAYSFTPHQLDQRVQRMNMYPSDLARLGYIIETKQEIQMLNKVIENFFIVIDFNEYFPNRIPFIFSPLFFVGLYYFFKERNRKKKLFFSFLISIVILTLIGPFAKYGPILIMPYLYLFIALGFVRVFHLKWL